MTGPAASASGYLDPAYRDSFRPFGDVLTLPASGLHLLKRPLPGGGHDLAGLYPYSSLSDWSGLAADIRGLRGTGAVALSLVTDPFQESRACAALAGWDVSRPFKTHWIVDLGGDWRARRSRNTRYYAARGLGFQDTAVVDDPTAYAADFWRLYSAGADRLNMAPMQRLSPQIVARQLALDDAFLTVARRGGELSGAMITMHSGETAYLHIMGMAAAAARLHTSYALFHTALAHLETLGCRLVSLGGGAGPTDDPEDGLYRFKKRWATESRRTWFGGVVLDRAAHAALCARAGAPDTGYFPGYRAPGSPFAWRAPV